MNLQLLLKKKWFGMTKSGVKTEDYREITPYWCKRLLTVVEGGIFNWVAYLNEESDPYELLAVGIVNNYFTYNQFDSNIMTLGYPKATETERILKYEHKGIEIREGNPEWGAEPGKLYFVIMHGDLKF
ncbi:MAG: hypothetical protein GY928_14855 [Colwellia sp.]|nr:hypothetical protein [Colwellia sp.]